MSDRQSTNPAMTRAEAEDRSLLWCVHAGCATSRALCFHLGLSPACESAIDRALAGLAQRGLLTLDGDMVALTESGSARLLPNSA